MKSFNMKKMGLLTTDTKVRKIKEIIQNKTKNLRHVPKEPNHRQKGNPRFSLLSKSNQKQSCF